MPHRTLLIIDDDKFWADLAAQFFVSFGYKVVIASTCAEGYEFAQLYKPACILLDYYLPDDEGRVCAANIRGNPQLRKTPMIMVSGDESQELPAHTDYQLDGFLTKDAQFVQIKAKVESLLRRVNWDRDVVTCSDLRLDGANLQVCRDSKPVARLTVEQFRLLSLLLEKSPAFVSEDELSFQVYSGKERPEKNEGIRGLAQRLRVSLGTQLGRRIKYKIKKGWIYVKPRARA